MWGSFFSSGKDPLKELGYEIVQESPPTTTNPRSIWTIAYGKKKATGDLVTIFSCQNEAHIQLAKSALKRMKTLRHPNVLVYLDGVETDKAVYVVTERALPLEFYLNDLKSNSGKAEFQNEHLLEIAWGLQQISRVMTFLHDDCKLSHGNINTGTIFVEAKSCDWKLACLEFVQSINEDQIHFPSKYLPACQRYELPNSSTSKGVNNQRARDLWLIGTMIWEIFNGPTATSASSYREIAAIPRTLSSAYRELVHSNPSSRASFEKLIQSPFISNNSLVECLSFLEQIQLKDAGEKQTFFNNLPDKVDLFPIHINERKVLPLLFNAYEFGSSGSAVLPTLFKLGKRLSDSDYKKRIVPIITKLFASTDRMTRFRLLQQLDFYVEHLTPAVVNDDIFNHICTGFNDQEPAIREATVKAMIYLAPKLNYKNLNVELMKHFSRLQTNDDQGVIRTNTIVCLGKIAVHLNPSLRGRLLISAFGRGTQDTFGPSRQASIYALNHSERFFNLKDIATKVLPILSHCTIDPELDVRQQAFKAINMFLKKLETVSEKPELAIEMEKDVNSSSDIGTANETSWTSWALTSLSSNIGKLTTKPQQPSVNLTLAKTDSQNTLSNTSNSTTPTTTKSAGNTTPVTQKSNENKLQSKAEKEEQNQRSSALSGYFNKTNDDEEEDEDGENLNRSADGWGDLETNVWENDREIDDEKLDELLTPTIKPSLPTKTTPVTTMKTSIVSTKTKSSPSPPPPSTVTTTTTTTTTNTASWTQDKPPASQSRNDWDSDAFFNDVLSTASKPKLKTGRR